MNTSHKSKSLACLLCALGGALGLHRFYLYGFRNIAGWFYLGATGIYLGILGLSLATGSIPAAVAALFPIPMFAAAIETLTIGLTEDGKWDARHNAHSLNRSRSAWPLAVLLVLTLGISFTGLVASMARATDLLYTGGSFG